MNPTTKAEPFGAAGVVLDSHPAGLRARRLCKESPMYYALRDDLGRIVGRCRAPRGSAGQHVEYGTLGSEDFYINGIATLTRPSVAIRQLGKGWPDGTGHELFEELRIWDI